MDVPFVSDVVIDSRGTRLGGRLSVPAAAAGIVAFAHGSGSSRFSSRNRQVAGALNEADLATLLFDLLGEAEQARDSLTGKLRFDIPPARGPPH